MTITATNTFSAGNAPVLRATSDSAADEYEDVTVTIDNSALTGPPADTVITAKCLGGDIIAPAEPLLISPTQIKVGDTSGAVAGNTYNMTTQLIECANGDILCIYGSGTSHYSNKDCTVYKRLLAGADKETGWGAETILHQDPDSVTNNTSTKFMGGGCGVDPDNGRIWLFLLQRDATSYATQALLVIYSDDHGVTWSTPTDLYPSLTFPKYKDGGAGDTSAPSPSPFGKVERTSLGLICPLYTVGKQTHLMVSVDGATWNESDFVLVDDYDGAFNLNEPTLVNLGSDNLVIVARDDTDDYKATWSMSTNGGATWTAFVTPTEFYDIGVDTPPTGAASVQVQMVGNRVYFWATAREPAGVYYRYACSKAEFLADPAQLWNHARTPTIVSTLAVSPGAQSYLNAGYASILPVAGHEYMALVSYYTPNATGSSYTDITIATMVRI